MTNVNLHDHPRRSVEALQSGRSEDSGPSDLKRGVVAVICFIAFMVAIGFFALCYHGEPTSPGPGSYPPPAAGGSPLGR